MFFLESSHKTVILSEAPHRSIAWTAFGARSRRACPERSRKNPEDAYCVDAVRSFSTTKARIWWTRHVVLGICFKTTHKTVILSEALHRFIA
jgi:hypothetical protein